MKSKGSVPSRFIPRYRLSWNVWRRNCELLCEYRLGKKIADITRIDMRAMYNRKFTVLEAVEEAFAKEGYPYRWRNLHEARGGEKIA